MPNESVFSALERDGLCMSGVSSGKIEKGLKVLLIAAAIVLAMECIWLFGVSPCIPLSTVEVNGIPGLDRAAVLEYAGIGANASYVSVNVQEAERLLGAHYLVEQARVAKRFPDRLTIQLQPRKAVALSVTMMDDRLVPVYFDRQGVVFRIGNSGGQAPQTAVPVISGLVITEPNLGMKLPSSLLPFLSELAVIEEKAPVLLEAISEIKVNRRPFDGFDLVLYPVHNPVRVRLGSSISEETLRYVLVILDVFEAQSAMPDELDFRSLISPYSVKEVPSG